MALSPVRARAVMSAGLAVTIAFTRSNSPALMASNNPAVSMTSVMTRSYPILVRAIGIFLLTMGCGTTFADAQTPAATQTPAPAAAPAPAREPPGLVTSIPEVALMDLPSSSDLYSLLETMQADLISDRMDTGGLGMAQ